MPFTDWEKSCIDEDSSMDVYFQTDFSFNNTKAQGKFGI